MAGGQDSLELLVDLCTRLGLACVVEAPDVPSLSAALAARPHVRCPLALYCPRCPTPCKYSRKACAHRVAHMQ